MVEKHDMENGVMQRIDGEPVYILDLDKAQKVKAQPQVLILPIYIDTEAFKQECRYNRHRLFSIYKSDKEDS